MNKPYRERAALAALSLSVLLPSLGISIANVGLPTLAQAFGASFQQVQWVVLAYLLATTTLIVGAGRLGDLFGRRRLLLAGMLLFTLASLAGGLAPTLALLIAARALQGMGAAVMMALGMALIAGIVPKERTGSAMGLLGTMSAVGTALGPTLGGLLIGAWGWRAIFLAAVPLGVLGLWLAWRHLPRDSQRPEKERASRTGIDPVGTLLLALALAAYALAMTSGRGSLGWMNLALLAAAALAAVLFVRVESQVASPLVRLAFLRDRTLGLGFLTSGLVSTVVMATLVVGPFYLAGALALEAAQVGLVLSAGPVAAALAGVPSGRLVDRWGAPRMSVTGLVAMLAGCGMLPSLAAAWGVPGYVAPLAVITAGYALFQAANNTAVMTRVPAEQRGVVSGLLNLSRNLGLVTGASMMGAVFAYGAAASDLSQAGALDLARGLRWTFAVAAGLSLLALIAALRAQPMQNAAILLPSRSRK